MLRTRRRQSRKFPLGCHFVTVFELRCRQVYRNAKALRTCCVTTIDDEHKHCGRASCIPGGDVYVEVGVVLAR